MKIVFLSIGKKYEECVNIPPPSNDDPICKKFFDSMTSQEIELPGRKDSYSITYWNETEVCSKKLNQ